MVKAMSLRSGSTATALAVLSVAHVLACGGGGASAQPLRPLAASDHDLVTRQLEARVEAMDLSGEGEPLLGRPIELYDPSGLALAPLYRALRRAEAGEGQARLVFYGASHVAGDYFTNFLREQLQARFGNAGHGFILPARPWRHYRHLGGVTVESSRRWRGLRVTGTTRGVEALGLAGMAVESDSAQEWGRLDTGTRSAGRFDLSYWRQPGGGSFDVYLDGRRVRRVSTDAREPGVDQLVLSASDARHVLEVRVTGNGPVRLFGVSVEREVPGIILDNLGISGARARSHLHWDEELQATQLRRLSPDLVVLAYGTNESGDDEHPIDAYEASLRQVVARIRGTVPGAACMLIGPSDRPIRQRDGTFLDRPRTHQLVEVQRRVSRDMGCAFFDLVAFGGGPLHMLEWVAATPAYAQQDHVHYTIRGYERLGEVLLSAMLARFDDVR